ncbi:DNA polymerase III subunit gamma and tau [Bombiscardovia apis]|uniref:DNA-directed DNA polymerase n=1 Tax=Bombiscardovia apis TaxID=2932182 RepID=A0ABM8BEJ0_9BIFI|nr:DNA polymerase III subunit gamma and tau [Bombiscardovia apis]BDR55345.1 DNA polymerase III subunit gamma and tau [Bombiscardovia apis]
MALALYRRYRPDTFDGVIGQKQVTVPLSRALDQGKLTHAYLFSGPRGCGKTSSARIFARCINCAQGPTSHPCGECESCRDLATGGPGSIDVVEIDAASHNGVDDARELRERAGFAPVRDRFKIFILDEAHMVTQQGFNALLKIVEEPPEHVMFMFATTEPDKVIGTIRSRTHHYPFRLVPQEVMGPYLEQICADEKIKAEPGVLTLAMRAGGGSVRDTLSVLDQLMVGSDEGTITYDAAVALLGYTPEGLIGEAVDAVIDTDGPKLYGVVQKVVVGGFEPKRFVEDLLQRLRDLLVLLLAGQSAESSLSEDSEAENVDDLQRQAQAFGLGRLTRIADIVNDALASMSGATSPRMRLELLAARLLVPESEMVQQVAAGPQQGGNAAAGPAGGSQGGFVGARRANGPAAAAAPAGNSGQNQAKPAQPQQAPVAQPTQSPAPAAAPNKAPASAPTAASEQAEQSAAGNGHENMTLDQRWDALVAALPDGVQEYVVRSKVPNVSLGRNAKGRPVLAMTFDQPLSQHAFALAVASRSVEGETKIPNIVMARARQEFGPETMIAPSGVAANGEKVESVARMSPERRSEVKKQIALARANMSAMNLGQGVAPHTASDAASNTAEQAKGRAHGQRSGAESSAASDSSSEAAADSDEHHPASAPSESAVVAGTAGAAGTGDSGDSGEPAAGAGKPQEDEGEATGGPAPSSQPLPAAGFASTESYVKPDELDDDDPWAHPQPAKTVNLGPTQQAGQLQPSVDQEEAEEERKTKKMGLPDMSDQDDPWAQPDGQIAPVSAAAAPASPVPEEDAAVGAAQPAEQEAQEAQADSVVAEASPVAQSADGGQQVVHNSGFAATRQTPAVPEVSAEEDSYSLDDARQGADSLMGPEELSQMFRVKHVEDLAADDPKNPLNANKHKRQQGLDD